MKILRIAMACALGAVLNAQAAPATETDEDWMSFGRMLALAHAFVRMAADAPDEAAMKKGVDGVMAGNNSEVNRAATGLLAEVTEDMPPAQRAAFAAFGSDLMRLARREQARTQAERVVSSASEAAIAARKDLHGMGLSYFDATQFLDAVRRRDALAVELFLAARGVDPAARDAQGRSAREIARAAGDARISALLAGTGAR
ncbi:MAG TPA: hypothetical protein VIS77_09640 [Burkholderiales bacterium]